MKRLVAILLLTLILFSTVGCSDIIRWKWKMAGVSEEGRRETFEKTKSYNEGKEQDLLRYRLEYFRATTDIEREALASTIRLMFADYDASLLEPELGKFLNEIKYGGLNL